jgi:hypothetical protein
VFLVLLRMLIRKKLNVFMGNHISGDMAVRISQVVLEVLWLAYRLWLMVMD